MRSEWRLLPGVDDVGLKHCPQDKPCTNLLKSTLVKRAPMIAAVSLLHIPSRQPGGTQKIRHCGLPCGWRSRLWLSNATGSLAEVIHSLVRWRLTFWMSLGHSTCQIRIVSLAPDTTNSPSGEKAMELTDLVWPSKGPDTIPPVWASQTRTVWSADPDATNLPFGENATVLILSEW